MNRKFKITVDGETFEVEVEEVKSKKTITKINKVNGELVNLTGSKPKVEEEIIPAKNTVSNPKPVAAVNTAKPGKGIVTAPLPGEILSINVKEGTLVSKGDQLLVIEAMKMENEVFAPVGGVVKGIFINLGDYVETGQKLVEIGEQG